MVEFINKVDRPVPVVSKSSSKNSTNPESSSKKEKKEKVPKKKKEVVEKKPPLPKPQYKSLKLLKEQKPEKIKAVPRELSDKEISRRSTIAAALDHGE